MSTENQANSLIEINGIKMEVDFRTASMTKIETLRVGQRVKMLKKGYSESYTSHPAIVIGFEAFPSLPTIQLMYLSSNYGDGSINYQSFNAKTEGVELILDPGDIFMEMQKEKILAKLNSEIQVAETTVESKKQALSYFLKHFGAVLADELAMAEQA